MRDKVFPAKQASARRLILRFRGPGPVPAEALERIRGLAGTTVLDRSSRMLLVEGPERELETLVASLPGWVMSPERMMRVPTPRLKPRRRGEERE